MRRKHRPGISLIESMLAVILIAVVTTAALQWLALVGRQQASAERRIRAAIEAANLADRVAAQPADRVTDEWLAGLAPASPLPGVSATARLAPAGENPAQLRVVVEVRPTDEADESRESQQPLASLVVLKTLPATEAAP